MQGSGKPSLENAGQRTAFEPPWTCNLHVDIEQFVPDILASIQKIALYSLVNSALDGLNTVSTNLNTRKKKLATKRLSRFLKYVCTCTTLFLIMVVTVLLLPP